MDINTLKQANEIFTALSDKTVEDALSALNTFEKTDVEVLRLVKSLITNSSHSSTYFDAKMSKAYQYAIDNPWQAGDEIGGYRLLELIGKGGMSVVFKAQRIGKETQKPVAIKIFNLPHNNAEMAKRFQSEQHILTGLTHPNVIDFHHGESNEQGVSFIVMELVDDGVPIDDYVKNKQPQNKSIVKLLLQAAHALHHAHKHLVVHLDVKPSNLLVTENGQIKVLDFGIAKLINADVNLNEADKNNTLVALTPSFASPEQIKLEGINTSSDVFSLAAVAVKILTGEQPFPANRLLTRGQDDEAHVCQLLNKKIEDKDLKHVLLKALRHEPQHRYQDMSAFIEDLKAWLDKKPVTASKNTWWYRLNRFVVRRTALFATSMVLLLTILMGITVLGMQNKAIQAEANKANAVKQFMLDAFSVTDPDLAQGADISAKDLLLSAGFNIQSDQDLDEETKFELYKALAVANGRLGFYAEAIDLLNLAFEINPNDESAKALWVSNMFASGKIEELNQRLSKIDEHEINDVSAKISILNTRALLAAKSGAYQQAFKLQKRISLLPLNKEEYILNQALLAEIHFLNGAADESVKIINSIKESHLLEPTDVLSLGLNSDLVQYHDHLGNFEDAMTLTKENIESFKAILGENHPDLGLAYNSLAAFQWLSGQLDGSLESSAVSEQIFRKRFGGQSDGLAQAFSNQGMAYFYKQEYDSAIEKLEQATNMLDTIYGAENPETMNAKANFATILNAVGKTEKALPILLEMYEFESVTYGKSHRSSLYTQQSLALALAKSGQFDMAIQHAQENQELIHKEYTKSDSFINNINAILCRIHYMAKKYEPAIEHCLNHITLWIEGNENSLVRSYYLMAKSHFALENREEAFKYFNLWTVNLKKLYQETDAKYLDGLLSTAEFAQKAGRLNLKKTLMSEVKNIIEAHQLELPEIEKILKELSSF